MEDKIELSATLDSEILIEINNFRSIEHICLTLTGVNDCSITQLVGKNNCGKSNILKCVHKALNTNNQYIRKIETTDRFDKDQPITLKITIPKISKTQYVATVLKDDTFFKWKPEMPPVSSILLSAIPDSEELSTDSGTKLLGMCIGKLYDKYYDNLEKDTDIKAKINDLSELIFKKDNLLLKDIIGGVSDNLKNVDNDLQSIRYYPKDINIKDLLKTRLIKIACGENLDEYDFDKMGTGTQRLILLLMLLQLAKLTPDDQKEDLILLIEEPEIFMHPQQQRAIANLIYSLFPSSNKGLKMVISTHSPYFINHRELSQLRLVRKQNNKTKIVNDGKPITNFSFIQNPKIDRKEMADVCTLFRMNPNAKEVFFANKVIIVEGHNEELSIPLLLRELHNFDMNVGNVSILNTTGNPNIPLFMKVLTLLSIPFVVALDLDSGTIYDKKFENIIKVCNELNYDINKLITINTDFCTELYNSYHNTQTTEKKKLEDFEAMEYTISLIKKENSLNDKLCDYLEKIKLNLASL